MSESWKNRLWSLLLVCTFAVVLSVCNKAMDSSSGGSSSGTAFADGSTVTISSLPSITVASSPLPTYSASMFCGDKRSASYNNGVTYYIDCDASDDDSSIIASKTLNYSSTNNANYAYVISHDTAFKNGWKLHKTGGSNGYGYTFVK